MGRVAGAFEEVLHDLATLVRSAVLEKQLHFRSRRYSPRDVEEGAAEKLGVVGRQRWLDFFLGPLFGDLTVNLGREPQRRIVGDLRRRDCRRPTGDTGDRNSPGQARDGPTAGGQDDPRRQRRHAARRARARLEVPFGMPVGPLKRSNP